jgi:hypothetical protein
MGVKGLFQFLKRFEKDIYLPSLVSNKSVGIDIFWFLHQSKGDLFAFQNSVLQIVNNAAKVHCVFDGAAPEDKRELLNQQAQKRKTLLESIRQIEKFLNYPFNRLTSDDRRHIQNYLNQLKRQAWQPPPDYIQAAKTWLQKKGCEIYQAEGEADEILINLENKGIIDVIVTNDSDLLVIGSKNIVRPISSIRGALFSQDRICEILGFTAQQWSDFMFLCKHMRENDVLLAYSLISVYKELDYGLQKYATIHNRSLIEDLSMCD